MKKFSAIILSAIILPTILSSCGLFSSDVKPDENTSFPESSEDRRKNRNGKIGGEDGLSIFGGGKNQNSIGVNAYLWRASLDTVSFMPLAQVDPHGGVIITDWYSGKGGEKIKINIVIMGDELKSDAVRASIFKQVGGKEVKASEVVETELEDKILARARELKVSALR
jgi:hypothetical protein